MRYEDYDSLIMGRSGSISYISDIETYEMIHLTCGGMEAYGFTDPEQYIGKKCYKILQGLDEPCPFCTNSCLEEGKDYRWEYFNENLGKWFDLTDTLVNLDDRICRLEIARDITKRKEELLQLENQLSLENALLKSLNILTTQKDMNVAMQIFLATIGGYYGANRAYIFEFDLKRQILNNTFEWCLPGVSAEIEHLQNIPLEVVDDWIRKFKSCGEFYIASVDGDVNHNSEEYRILEMQGIESLMAAPLMEGDTIMGFLGVDDPTVNFGDLTLLRATSEFVMVELEKRHLMRELRGALDKANVANHSKTKFLFNMSHDIRTPMNAILGFSMMAEKYVDDKERVLDSLGKLNRAGKHLQRLINDVLDMSRVESGKMAFNLQPHHIPSLLEDTRELFGVEMKKKDIEFTALWDIEDEVAWVDQLRMEQIEMNLISNALKYTPEGGKVSYTISQIEKTEDGYAVYQGTVKDTGIGMSEEFCEKVFEPFEREKTSTVDKIQGTGLGLSITKSLVEQMGGSIICRSSVGKGTEFVFNVKLRVGRKEDLPKKIERMVSKTEFSGKRILLVEDNELNREIAHDILEEYGFLIDTAEDGDIAVDMVKKAALGYYQLILMDIQMPRMDGYEATRQIRRLEDRDLANIPIVAMTANAFEEDIQNALAAGMDAHIAKPLDISKLFVTLQQIL
ncbi:MAG: response regulator [Lachnospiraceae bacterium]|nr:response regulator [Lachnospiraceae bacterium]